MTAPATTHAQRLPPGVPHDGCSAIDGHGYPKRVLCLASDWLPERAQGRSVRHATNPGSAPLTAVQRVHAALRHPGDLMAAEHWLVVVRDHVLSHLGTRPPTSEMSPWRRFRDLFDDHFTESFTITAAAEEIGAHPIDLMLAFSQAYGIAPHQYVIGRRLDLVRRLLAVGQRPADVAALAGFYDQVHLARHFRRTLGTTPVAFVPAVDGEGKTRGASV